MRLGRFPLILLLGSVLAANAAEPFRDRGYYLTFMRMPVMGLADWQAAVDCFAEDRANLLILWTAGGFRSRKYPVTWRYNTEHQNVREDFLRQLIDYSHSKGIRVLLGFTPFGYDGVNQLPLEKPELKARQANGQPVDMFGIHAWGWNLCASNPEAQEFMRQYVREMLFDFYPNADGLFIESSDYGICHCPDCGPKYYEREFDFVRAISQEVWQANTNGMVVVYPHYFTGKKVPGMSASAARMQFDPRWTLFFTPHSAHFDAELLGQTSRAIYWCDSPVLGTPRGIQDHARKARDHGMTGFVPSLEAFSYVPSHAEGGEAFVVGKRRQPFGLDAFKDGRMPYRSLIARIQRCAVREFSANPDLPFSEFEKRVGVDLFGSRFSDTAVKDALALQEIWARDSDWYWASPLLDPEFFKARAASQKWSAGRLQEYRLALETLRGIAERYRTATNVGERQLHTLAVDAANRWGAETP